MPGLTVSGKLKGKMKVKKPEGEKFVLNRWYSEEERKRKEIISSIKRQQQIIYLQ